MVRFSGNKIEMQKITWIKIKEIWNHTGFQKYLKNTGWMFFGRFFTLGVSFFVGIYIARYLGPSNYGLLSYVASFVGIFGFLASFGIDSILSREIIKDHDKKDELIGTAFYIKVIGSVVAILSIFIVSIFTTRDLFTLGLIWIFSLSFIPQAFNIIEIYFQSQVLSKTIVIAQVTSNICSVILKILVIILNKGIFWLTLIIVVESLIYGGIILFNYRKFGNHIKDWKFNKNVAKSLLKDSWPLMLSAAAAGIYMKIDQVMIKNMLGNEQSGIYAVAVRISEIWYFIPGIICGSIFPAIANAKKLGNEIFQKRISKLLSAMFWLSFIIALPISFFSKQIINILYGQAYIGASVALSIYVWAGICISLWMALNQYFIITKSTKILFYTALIGVVTNIGLNIILIPKLQVSGAALATLISYSVVTICLLLFKKYQPKEKITNILK
jgi:O-antigen/teichoic acid export membrane protein